MPCPSSEEEGRRKITNLYFSKISKSTKCFNLTGTELAALIRFKSRTNTVTFTNSDMLVLVNLKKDILASAIQQYRNEVWNIPATDDLVKDQREYAYPTDVMNNLVDLELKFSSSETRVPLRT